MGMEMRWGRGRGREECLGKRKKEKTSITCSLFTCFYVYSLFYFTSIFSNFHPSLSLVFPLFLLLWANRLGWPRGCWKVSSGSCWVCCWMSKGGRSLRSLCQGHHLKLGTGCCLSLPWAWGRRVTLHVRGLYFQRIPPEFKQWANSAVWCCISSYS